MNKYLEPGKHVDVSVPYQAYVTAKCAGVELFIYNTVTMCFNKVTDLTKDVPYSADVAGKYRVSNESNCQCVIVVAQVAEPIPEPECPVVPPICDPEPECPEPEPEPECPVPEPEPEPEPECDKDIVWQLVLVDCPPEDTDSEPECPVIPACPTQEPACPAPCHSTDTEKITVPSNLLDAIACAFADKVFKVQPDFAPLLSGLALMADEIVTALAPTVESAYSFGLTNQAEGVAGAMVLDVWNVVGLNWHFVLDLDEHPKAVDGVSTSGTVSPQGVVAVSIKDATDNELGPVTLDIGALIASGSMTVNPAGDYTVVYDGTENSWVITDISTGMVKKLAPDVDGNLTV